MTTRSPVTAAKPRRSAAPLPAFAWRSSVKPSSRCSASSIVARAVGRSVVDDDQLDAQRDGEHAPDDFLDRGTLVVHGHDHRQEQRRSRADSMRAKRTTRSHTMNRLVILAPNWLGDAVMALPAIADVRRASPERVDRRGGAAVDCAAVRAGRRTSTRRSC